MIDESKIIIRDDYLSREQYESIKEYFMGEEMYWYYCGNYSGGYPQMERVFYNEFVGTQRHRGTPINETRGMHILRPILDSFNYAALIRIRAVCNWKTGTMSQRDWHVDVPFDCTTAIYYLHDSDGCTIFEDGDNEPLECDTKANRLVEFPSQYRHSTTTFTRPERRVLINFNFIRALKAKSGETFICPGLAIQHPMS